MEGGSFTAVGYVENNFVDHKPVVAYRAVALYRLDTKPRSLFKIEVFDSSSERFFELFVSSNSLLLHRASLLLKFPNRIPDTAIYPRCTSRETVGSVFDSISGINDLTDLLSRASRVLCGKLPL